MGILLGLLTASFWGASDFVARFAAHKIGALRTSLYMQLAGFLLLSIFLPWLGGWGHLFDGSGWQPWGWGVLAGTLNAVSTLSLYRSFEVGKLAVVAPLSASYPALTVALSMFTGEHLTAPHLIGIAFIVAGVALVAGGETTPFHGNGGKIIRRKIEAMRRHGRRKGRAESAGRSFRRSGSAFCSGCLVRELFPTWVPRRRCG